jgi:hypothetical protein
MRLRALTGLLFAGIGVWMLFENAWVTPGLLLFGAAQVVIPIAVWPRVEGRAVFVPLGAFLVLTYLGAAYSLALFAGMPTTAAFWAAFGALVFVSAPIVWLFRRTTLGEAVG